MPSGLESKGLFRPTAAGDMMKGDLLILDAEVDWDELLVVGVCADGPGTLLLLMEEDGTLRSWDGPSSTPHVVMRRLSARASGRGSLWQ